MTRRPLWLLGILLLAILIAAGAWLLMSDSGLRWAYGLARSSLLGQLEIQSLEGRLAGPIRIEGLRYQSDTIEARVDRATLDWSVLALVTAKIRVTQLTVTGVRVVLGPPAPSDDKPLNIDLPLRLRIDQLDVNDVQIQRAGQAPYEISAARFAGHLAGNTLEVEEFELRTPSLDVTAAGALGFGTRNSRLQADWKLHTPAYPPASGHLSLSGTLAELSVESRTEKPFVSTLNATVKNVLEENATWQAELNAPTVALAHLKPGIKGDVALHALANGDRLRFNTRGTLRANYAELPPVNGEFKLNGSFTGVLEIDELKLRTSGKSAIRVSGNWDISKQSGHMKAQWTDLTWPLDRDPAISSPNGSVEIKGSLAAYSLAAIADLQGDKLPSAAIRAVGNGNLSRLKFDELELRTLAGKLTGKGHLAWAPSLDWSARLDGSGIDPASVWPEWQGNLALAASAVGNAKEVRLDLTGLRGTLRGRNVNVHGKLVQRQTDYPLIELYAQSGQAKGSVTGSIQKSWNLAWQINAPDLTALLPQTRGTLDAAGRISGDRGAPTIEAKLNGRNIAYTDFRAQTFKADVAIDLSDRTSSRASVDLTEIVYADREFAQLSAATDGYIANHTIRLAATTDGNELRMRLAGKYSERNWRGELAESQWKIGNDTWHLAQPALWNIGASRIAIDQTCWTKSLARLCANLNRNGDRMDIGLISARAPLSLLAPLLPQPMELSGTIDGNAALQFRAGRMESGSADFTASPGSVRSSGSGTGTAFTYESARLNFRIEETALRGRMELRLPNGDGGGADIVLPQFNAREPAGRDQPLQGKIELAFRDLSPFTALLPDIEELRGAVRVDFKLQGTLADPQVRGDARLTDGSVRLPALGIRLREMRLVATPEGRTLRLNGYARSGDGELGVSGRLLRPADAAWRAELRLAGSQVLALDLPDAQIFLTPDLRVTAAPGVVDVRGDVAVPRARITPRPRPKSATPSRDVVIVGASTETLPETPIESVVTAEINVALGNDVTFEGFGLTGNITGAIALIDTPGTVTLARGELRVVNGRYEAYGQKLEIEHGRLLFAGGPVEEPGVDARAVRRVDSITVGINVKGTLKQPQLTLFSDPSMGESDALSYLLFGKPLETANASQGAALAGAARALQLSGGEHIAQRLGARFGIEEVDIQSGSGSEASLVLGKRLSPRLYINYSIGLFQPINVFRIRYELTTNWVLQAESGLNRGADLLFTIER